MKLRRKVLKFRKARFDRGYDAAGEMTWYEVSDASLFTCATNLAKLHYGYIVKTKLVPSFSTTRCKIVIKLPEEEWGDFVVKFTNSFMTQINCVEW